RYIPYAMISFLVHLSYFFYNKQFLNLAKTDNFY
ncbi:unnamed protein product, partial [marine sediment metagenome]